MTQKELDKAYWEHLGKVEKTYFKVFRKRIKLRNPDLKKKLFSRGCA